MKSQGTDSINRYRPVPPSIAIDDYVAKLKDKESAARVLAGQLDQVLAAGKDRELWAPPFEVVKGMRQVRPTLVEQIRAASREILFFGKGPIVPEVDIAQAMFETGESGIKVRMVLERDYLEEADAKEEAVLYRQVRGDKRVTERLPTKLLIIDRRIAAVSVTRTAGETFLIQLVRHEGMLQHYIASFELHWAAAEPLVRGRARGQRVSVADSGQT